MAQVTMPGKTQLLGADDLVVLSDVSDCEVGTIMVHLVTESAGTIAVTVKGRARSVGHTEATPAFLPIPYLVLTAAGVVGSGAYASAVLAGNDIILIPATGLAIALDVAYTSGTHRVYVERLIGSAA